MKWWVDIPLLCEVSSSNIPRYWVYIGAIIMLQVKHWSSGKYISQDTEMLLLVLCLYEHNQINVWITSSLGNERMVTLWYGIHLVTLTNWDNLVTSLKWYQEVLYEGKEGGGGRQWSSKHLNPISSYHSTTWYMEQL